MTPGTILDVLLDSVHDTLELIPFLFLTYLAMEALEHTAGGRTERIIARADKSGPIVGALLGALPQCGFSAMAGTLYAARVVSAGTLVSVILATSDEMIPVFVAHAEPAGRMFAIIGFKVVAGMIVGLLVDAVLRALHRAGDGHAHIAELCEAAHCDCGEIDADADGALFSPGAPSAGEKNTAAAAAQGDAHNHAHAHGHDHAHGHGASRGRRVWHIVRSALVHTAEVTFFIFLVTLVFGFVIEAAGTDAIAQVLGSHPVRATMLAALIGLIPNCGASVAITQLYLQGSLAAGPMMAGLLVSGGMGLLVLFRTNRDMRQNLVITAFVYVVGVVLGLVVAGLGIIF
ncbi:putative manganese transporter [Parafannyhessea umbonata]|uniref:putative manganese transporter n=1 Tax=Parafannyhessea TaxID=2847312 RepID=UPI0026F31974|nr:putative manganese transporter [Parafannyhessea umbonata]MCI6681201.1 arsenic efflux protein [Parafannyhessea umbonata]MCI7218853.1 arsenic efflux protein [Parafannyhessea umbonata]MDD6601683.1 putative manganese transporter [Parafannyhessea umbonata]